MMQDVIFYKTANKNNSKEDAINVLIALLKKSDESDYKISLVFEKNANLDEYSNLLWKHWIINGVKGEDNGIYDDRQPIILDFYACKKDIVIFFENADVDFDFIKNSEYKKIFFINNFVSDFESVGKFYIYENKKWVKVDSKKYSEF